MYNERQTKLMINQRTALPTVIGEYDITLGKRVVSYTLKRSRKAKLIWLGIKPRTGLTVTIPYYYDIKYLNEYLITNSRWILRNLDKYCKENPALEAKTVRPANTISYLGKCITVTQKRNITGLTALKLEQNNLIVNLNPSAGSISSEELEQWLKMQAAQVINVKVKKFSTQMHLAYNRVVIRDQKSRWGSCSCLKNLNFNWRLIMAPEPVLDYVIIHELCHLREMSHSKSFWKLVAQYCPQWHELRSWLDNHCIELNASLQI
jgi:predicted metal-dependent hydrolase